MGRRCHAREEAKAEEVRLASHGRASGLGSVRDKAPVVAAASVRSSQAAGDCPRALAGRLLRKEVGEASSSALGGGRGGVATDLARRALLEERDSVGARDRAQMRGVKSPNFRRAPVSRGNLP
jgi:hypothetical protein